MKKQAIIAAAMIVVTATASAQDFFDTSAPERMIGVGVRVGVNTSNQTSPGDGKDLSLDSWGTGFTAGAVVDLNFREFFTLQPGVFFESRSHNYSYITKSDNTADVPGIDTYGHTRSTWMKIPLMASVRMNPASSLQWALEAGPVFGFGLGGSDKTHFDTPSTGPLTFKTGYFDTRKKWSFGWKFGTTVRYARHYSIGVHYEAGTSRVYKDLKGGHHKAWTFTLGYDF